MRIIHLSVFEKEKSDILKYIIVTHKHAPEVAIKRILLFRFHMV